MSSGLGVMGRRQASQPCWWLARPRRPRGPIAPLPEPSPLMAEGRAGASPGAVIAHPPTEFSEQEHDHILGRIVFPEVGEEGFNGLGHVRPQGGMYSQLIGVRIEAQVVAVEN